MLLVEREGGGEGKREEEREESKSKGERGRETGTSLLLGIFFATTYCVYLFPPNSSQKSFALCENREWCLLYSCKRSSVEYSRVEKSERRGLKHQWPRNVTEASRNQREMSPSGHHHSVSNGVHLVSFPLLFKGFVLCKIQRKKTPCDPTGEGTKRTRWILFESIKYIYYLCIKFQ